MRLRLAALTAIILSQVNFSPVILRILGWVGFALVFGMLAFSGFPFLFPLGATGLEETLLAIGTCLLDYCGSANAVAVSTRFSTAVTLWAAELRGCTSHTCLWSSLSFTHFSALGKPMWFVPSFFLFTIIIATILGDLVARLYSDPLNAKLRRQWGEGKLGSALEQRVLLAPPRCLPPTRLASVRFQLSGTR